MNGDTADSIGRTALALLLIFGMIVLALAGLGTGGAIVTGQCTPNVVTGDGRTQCGDMGWDMVYGAMGLQNPQTGR